MESYNIQLDDLSIWQIVFPSITLFIGAFICVNLLTPIIIWISYQKRLITPINMRSSHSSITPPFGGVAFYMTFIVFIAITHAILNESAGYHIIAATSILFMIGLKDDLVHSTAKVKLLTQLLAGIFIISSPKFRILIIPYVNYNLDSIWPAVFSALLLILIINAYNLIDGIDGLAAMTGIIVCIAYAVLFYIGQDLFFFLFCIVTLGVLSAFLRFNLSKNNLKVFMGDCGSLVIGLIIGICTLRLLAYPSGTLLPGDRFSAEYRLLLICAILFVPFLDTSRIIIVRLTNCKNPFKADKNHVHHVLIACGLSHIKATLLLSAIQICVIFMFITASEFASTIALSGIILFIYTLAVAVLQIITAHGKKNQSSLSDAKNQYTGF